MNEEDPLAEKFIKIIKEYDVNNTIENYNVLGKLFSSVIRTNPEIRKLFLEDVKSFSKKVKNILNQMEFIESKKFTCKIKKTNILN